jgi:hypothetical protein
MASGFFYKDKNLPNLSYEYKNSMLSFYRDSILTENEEL